MLPGAVIIMTGLNPMKSLVLSQVSLSFALPFAIIPMLIITNNKHIMGRFANTPVVKAVGIMITSIIIVLNAVLLYLSFTQNI
jgi:manganese transport protein